MERPDTVGELWQLCLTTLPQGRVISICNEANLDQEEIAAILLWRTETIAYNEILTGIESVQNDPKVKAALEIAQAHEAGEKSLGSRLHRRLFTINPISIALVILLVWLTTLL
jgi:hypothetical protein